ncbi:MAG: hypothetical protein NC043_05830 [Muribaculaceae bacterium]|nr:hypothetical protein [Muribaculaceae bacterium]
MISSLPIRTFTADEMLRLYMQHSAFELPRTDTGFSRTDGIDLESLIATRLRAWYVDTLLTAPLDSLPLTDVTQRIRLVRAPSGAGEVSLPAGCLRVAQVMMKSWERPARIVTDPASPLALDQHCRFTRGGRVSPAAVVEGSTLRLYTPSADTSDTLTSLLCVLLPPDGTYHLTDPLLSTIPTLDLPLL